MTFAERFIQKACELMPLQEELYDIDPTIDNPRQIDEIVFGRSEYLGGMAAVILELVKRESTMSANTAGKATITVESNTPEALEKLLSNTTRFELNRPETDG